MNDPSNIPDDPFDSVSFYNLPRTPPAPVPVPPKKAVPAVEAEDDEYELEEPDEEVVQSAERRAAEDVAKANAVVDIDALYREENAEPDWGEIWQGFRFRYQTKHLLILTAIVAVLTAAITQAGAAATIIVAVLVGLAAAHGYLAYHENQRQQRLDLRRQQLYERARLVREGKPVAELPPLEPFQETDATADEHEPFSFAFSRNEWLTAAAIAALLLGCFWMSFGFGSIALPLGIIALVGLGVLATGFKLPRTVVLGWWLLLVMYVVASVLSAFGG